VFAPTISHALDHTHGDLIYTQICAIQALGSGS
jgi:hypothetical protein